MSRRIPPGRNPDTQVSPDSRLHFNKNIIIFIKIPLLKNLKYPINQLKISIIVIKMAYVFNYVFQKKDDRDYIYKPQNLKLNPSHFITDVAMFTAPILDQGPIGSCLANAANSLFYITSKGAINLSRLQWLCIHIGFLLAYPGAIYYIF